MMYTPVALKVNENNNVEKVRLLNIYDYRLIELGLQELIRMVQHDEIKIYGLDLSSLYGIAYSRLPRIETSGVMYRGDCVEIIAKVEDKGFMITDIYGKVRFLDNDTMRQFVLNYTVLNIDKIEIESLYNSRFVDEYLPKNKETTLDNNDEELRHIN